ncbi:hypothetical protein ABPG75_001665 [Micractinium tetrahymenae]
MLDDGVRTTTSIDQAELERRVTALYAKDYSLGGFDPEDEGLLLDRKAHAQYLSGGLGSLPAGFISLDASRTWICYWITHGLALLGAPLPPSPSRESIIAFLASCQHPDGGFGGGPNQLAHLAPTYAAVAALVTLGGEDALSVVDWPRLHAFLLRMCVPPERGGGMTMHEGGEVDVRGCYCALAACEMLRLDKQAVAGACDMVGFIRRCQSHEGGIGGEPWNEAHGGYTFCGLAAAALLGQAHRLDLDRLLRWAVRCQSQVEGGFMGRTNKLVDGCYSFWQGGAFPLLAQLLAQQAQQAQQAEQGAAAGGGSDDDAAATLAAAARLCRLLLDDGAAGEGSDGEGSPGSRQGTAGSAPAAEGGDGGAAAAVEGQTLKEWVNSLPHLSPRAAAARQLESLRQRLDAAVEASLEAEEAYAAARGGPAGGPLQQEAVAALQRASDLQQALDSCQQHADALSCGAATLLDAAGPRLEPAAAAASAGSSAAGAAGGEGARLPQLYDAAALQLWLLKACQALPRGGLRDKPGKPADYYHTCYCLSGLSSCQHYSGIVLGGPQNLLARADTLCNVEAGKLAAARSYFAHAQGGAAGGSP